MKNNEKNRDDYQSREDRRFSNQAFEGQEATKGDNWVGRVQEVLKENNG